MAPSDLDYVLRLLLAAACGGLIGLERQYRSRTAGLRTQSLVAIGAASFVLFGVQAGIPAAPLQIAAYVVSGVGFLGGGVILRQGFSVQGLNTAATLWCSAAIGCQAAGGHVIPALATTALVLVAHVLLRPLARLVDRAPAAQAERVGVYTLTVRVLDEHEPELRTRFSATLDTPDLLVHGVTSRLDETEKGEPQTSTVEAELLVEGNAAAALDRVVTVLAEAPGVRDVAWRAENTSADVEGDIRVRPFRRLHLPRLGRG